MSILLLNLFDKLYGDEEILPLLYDHLQRSS